MTTNQPSSPDIIALNQRKQLESGDVITVADSIIVGRTYIIVREVIDGGEGLCQLSPRELVALRDVIMYRIDQLRSAGLFFSDE